MYPTDLYHEIASLRGHDMRKQAANERMLHRAAQREPTVPTDPRRDAAYRRLAVAILGLDVNTLADALRFAHH